MSELPLRVVVVDDDPAVASLHARLIGDRPDCEVVATAGTGPRAVDAITALEPDLVLLDIYLPEFSGLEVLRSIRSSHQPQPEFIAVTAARDFASVRDARLTGVRHYLVKPFSVRELNTRVGAYTSDFTAAIRQTPQPRTGDSSRHTVGSDRGCSKPSSALVSELSPDGSVHCIREGVDDRPGALGAVAEDGHRGACLRNVCGPE